MAHGRPSHTTRLGRYRLEEQLGAGGMATVHRAIIEGAMGFARPVVLKRIRPELAREPGFVEMMVGEARLCSQLRHPGIVQVHDFGEVDGQLYLAMELIDGHDLAAVLDRCRALGRRIPPALVAFMVAELAGALAYAHALHDENGQPLHIVHRDVSPSNVMATTLGGIKLLDFGIAKALTEVTDEQTRTGTLRGKTAYMSPEQADALPLDGRSDQFSLGVLFWESLTLRRLFKESSDFATLRRIRTGDVVPPTQLMKELDPRIDEIVMRMLATDRSQRYETCDAVTTALAPILHETQTDSRGLREFLATLEPIPRFSADAGEDQGSQSTGPWRARTRRKESRARSALLPALGVGLALVGLGAWTYARALRPGAHGMPSSSPPASSSSPSPPSSPPPVPTPTPTPTEAMMRPVATREENVAPASSGPRRLPARRAKAKAPTSTGVRIKNPFAK